MLIAKEEVQYIYRYKEDVYYNSNRYDGVYRLGPGGEIEKIQNIPRIKKRTDINLWLEDNLLYFIKDGKWHSLNLDTGQVKEQPGFQVEYASYFDHRHDFLEDCVSEKLGYINYCKVFSDGYIYFSTDNGLYRTRQGGGEPELLASGGITMFDIKGDRVKYYDIDSTPHVREDHLP
jgi:outer membrane protein assembly factor BamB